ncbi:class I SAM-dependent methyltransferase [Amycolatopsis cihanbeyliensis]|uniref:Ubiquinone/menaquinone biosynthesis C-methylase UbiE n=1 Tax=Amycolatopsis cihanbeyliensis TaxID=1128664 RepID=A0A542DMU7_AMYCI|nr:methyltransferase domain-containing protein [Amycolatopsis cihanbeyliensis]TQJ04421.1 ubiquinone/menaquinone biosynthesis C-methylase UbiE [Amycolatopsis cihanbeyliensis]
MQEGYSPGVAGFVLPLLRPGMRVLDAGCGSGAITLGLEAATRGVRLLGVDRALGETAPAAPDSSTVDFLAAAADSLPFPADSMDVVFAHALLERVADPAAVLGEFGRVLRPGGALALSTSDWSRARIRPRTANVDAALRGYQLLRRRDGGNPFAGRRVAEQVQRAGFTDVRSRTRYLPDRDYRELGRAVEAELAVALESAGSDRALLASAARSAWVWARGGGGEFSQCWVEILATSPVASPT